MSGTVLHNLRKAEKLLALGGVGRGELFGRNAVWQGGHLTVTGRRYCSLGAVAAVKLSTAGGFTEDEGEKIHDEWADTWPEVQELAETIAERTYPPDMHTVAEIVFEFNDTRTPEEVREIWRETILRLQEKEANK